MTWVFQCYGVTSEMQLYFDKPLVSNYEHLRSRLGCRIWISRRQHTVFGQISGIFFDFSVHLIFVSGKTPLNGGWLSTSSVDMWINRWTFPCLSTDSKRTWVPRTCKDRSCQQPTFPESGVNSRCSSRS